MGVPVAGRGRASLFSRWPARSRDRDAGYAGDQMRVWRTRARRIVHHHRLGWTQRERTSFATTGWRALSNTSRSEGQAHQSIWPVLLVVFVALIQPAAAQDKPTQGVD